MLDHNRREHNFLDSYYAQTGIYYRHYYGPNGPRSPPKLYMWPANYIGQVHKVISPEVFW